MDAHGDKHLHLISWSILGSMKAGNLALNPYYQIE